jgi:hypothetical protein
MKTDERYNGWKNWETWNLKLWLDNDYGNYQKYVTWLKSLPEAPTQKQCFEFVDGLYRRGVTPDFPSMDGDIKLIDWGEIHEAMVTEWGTK